MSCSHRRWIALSVTAILLAAVQRSSGAEDTTSDSTQHNPAQIAFDGFLAGRKALQTGVFRFAEITVVSTDGKETEPSVESGYYMFDHKADSFRFDRLRPAQTDGNNQPLRFIRTPDYVLLYGEYAKSITRMPTLTEVSLNADVIDPRLAGIANQGVLETYFTWEQWLTQARKKDFVLSGREGDDYVISWQFRPRNSVADVRYFATLDSKRDFVPVKHRFEDQRPRGNEMEWVSLDDSTCEWTQKNNVWVPTVWTSNDRIQQKGREVTTITVKFEWESVNTVIPKSNFDVEGFNAPAGMHVIDVRGMLPKMERIIGQEKTDRKKD